MKSKNAKLEESIRLRALEIIDKDNTIGESRKFPRRQKALREMQRNCPNIDSGRITIADIIDFSKEYGCTTDYLLGLSDNPYR